MRWRVGIDVKPPKVRAQINLGPVVRIHIFAKHKNGMMLRAVADLVARPPTGSTLPIMDGIIIC
jgi:hypothetical protein